jgi:hypothetical protein
MRQILVDMSVNDAIGIVLQRFKFVHDAIKTGGFHFDLHKRIFALLQVERVKIASLGQR